jgi:riboflavin kinase / FMN adenylyltransferase
MKQLPKSSLITKTLGPFAVGIGIFDGVHLGHQALIRRVCELARHDGIPSLIYTFHPHPAVTLRPEAAPPLIEPIEKRLQRFEMLGVDTVLVEHFDRAFSTTTAEQFVDDILVKRLQAKHIVVGEAFTFGAKLVGNVAFLQAQKDFAVHPIPHVKVDGLKVSSRNIRTMVATGDMQKTSALLGRPFEVAGIVVSGDKRGKQLGFPTANLQTTYELLPPPGIYAAYTVGPFGRMASAVNVGYSPTFAGSAFKIESFVLDYHGPDFYGVPLIVQFVERLREEKKFSSLEGLTTQIAADVAAVKSLFDTKLH